jgi:hypothetical protein
MNLGRRELADCIVGSLTRAETAARQEFRLPGRIPSFALDGLLPEEVAGAVHQAFPAPAAMVLKKTLGRSSKRSTPSRIPAFWSPLRELPASRRCFPMNTSTRAA